MKRGFRVYDKQEKRMIKEPNTAGIYLGGNGNLVNVDNFCLYLMNRYIRLDSTGLLDKNSEEIYEGDIVAFEKYNNHSNVWDIECCLPIEYFGDRFCARNKDDIHTLNFLPNHIEVIGNIYENPELLTP